MPKTSETPVHRDTPSGASDLSITNHGTNPRAFETVRGTLVTVSPGETKNLRLTDRQIGDLRKGIHAGDKLSIGAFGYKPDVKPRPLAAAQEKPAEVDPDKLPTDPQVLIDMIEAKTINFMQATKATKAILGDAAPEGTMKKEEILDLLRKKIKSNKKD